MDRAKVPKCLVAIDYYMNHNQERRQDDKWQVLPLNHTVPIPTPTSLLIKHKHIVFWIILFHVDHWKHTVLWQLVNNFREYITRWRK